MLHYEDLRIECFSRQFKPYLKRFQHVVLFSEAIRQITDQNMPSIPDSLPLFSEFALKET